MTALTVGIMSMQRIHNYGSSLQAYGLRRLVESVAPQSAVTFLDFRPGQPLVAAPDEHRDPLQRNLAKLREYNMPEAPVIDRLRFFNHKRSYGRNHFTKLGISPSHDWNHPVDVQIIGSDEVFNCVQANRNVGYSRDLFGHQSQANKLVTYAASFGNTTMQKVRSVGIERELREDLDRFEHLSVRDRHSQAMIEHLTGRSPDLHVDPALAYPFMTDEEQVPEATAREPYIIVYGYSGRLNREENRQLRAYANARGARILSFGGLQECADKFIDCDPFQLLAYFRGALGVVTDTYHGTIFSIINRKPFCSIVRPSRGHHYGNEEKLGDLLRSFGMTDRMGGKDFCNLLDETPDYASVDSILTRERARTCAYLTKVLT